MSEMKHAAPSSGADSTIDALHRIDDKVNALRDQRLNDPDSLLDKAFKWATPALTGAVAGKLFQLGWDRTIGRRPAGRNASGTSRGNAGAQGLLMSLAFAAASAAFGAVVAQLSDHTSKAIIAHRHRRHHR